MKRHLTLSFEAVLNLLFVVLMKENFRGLIGILVSGSVCSNGLNLILGSSREGVAIENFICYRLGREKAFFWEFFF